MARLARNRFWATVAQANGLHHVTNRGVGRNALFTSPIDRIIFLSMVASVCLDEGLRVHCFCLMTNHFHLLLEDPRGMLSRAMLRLETAYARYFRDMAGQRGNGHVYGDRFFSRRIGSARDYGAVVRYILLNPLRCAEPLAVTAEDYAWSSADMHIAESPASVACATMLARVGGIDAVIAGLPRAGSTRFEQLRRERLERLHAGEWLVSDAARQGRSGEQLRLELLAAVACGREEVGDEPVETTAVIDAPPVVMPEFRGHTRSSVKAALELLVGRPIASGELLAYALWRFADGRTGQIASMLRTSTINVRRRIAQLRSERHRNKATHEVLSRLEWKLTFALGGAPCRV